jgi:alpha-ketoglutaric semialdehyde dehydrogenase
MQLTGLNFIAGERRDGASRLPAHAPATGAIIEGTGFVEATPSDIADACAAAHAAFLPYSTLPLEKRATFLDAIADEIEALGDALIERACTESGLPAARITGERGRTMGQLRLFANEVRDGHWQQLRVDHADSARVPPRPDLRVRMVPLGPVAIFGASNFPLAFSVAGGDTASALAAGCPVVVKGHPSHPGTSELVAIAITRAAARSGVPAGVFSLVHGWGHAVGEALVADPRIKAVGFTGSRAGGEALMRIAAARPRPIPVYAEMSAINPVILLPHALATRSEALATAFIGSLTLGAGQFCTNPGLVLGIEGPDLDRFAEAAGAALSQQPAQVMLNDGIWQAFQRGKASLAASSSVMRIAEGQTDDAPNRGRAALFSVRGRDLFADPAHIHEVFGASAVLVRCADLDELIGVVGALEGQLTATLQLDPADEGDARALLPVLEQVAGRILANGWPTGVEVTHAMVHGGPYPATSDGRSTSVGTLSIDRFLRPVCYQDLPAGMLPEPLQDEAIGGALARIDGRWSLPSSAG